MLNMRLPKVDAYILSLCCKIVISLIHAYSAITMSSAWAIARHVYIGALQLFSFPMKFIVDVSSTWEVIL